MTQVGTVKLFQPDKGFGFITAADGSDIFLHVKECVDGGIPQKGDVVSYDLTESSLKPGQKQASNVTGGTGKKGSGKGQGPTGTGSVQGSVKNFNSEKGFGFIIGPDGSDIFLHIKAVVDGSIPQAGDFVSYDPEPNPAKPGQNRASNVTGGTGGKGNGKGKDSWGGDGGGYGAAGNWDGGKGKGGPYGDGGKGDGWGKGGKDDWMGEMWNWMMEGWGGKGDGWGGKGDGWGGKGGKDAWGGGKGDGWGGMDGKGENWGGKGECWGGKGESWGGKGKGDCWGGKGESWGGKGDNWGKGDSWGGKGESCGGGEGGKGFAPLGNGGCGGVDGYQGAPQGMANGAATAPAAIMSQPWAGSDPNAMGGAPNGAPQMQQQAPMMTQPGWGGDGGAHAMPPQGMHQGFA